MYNYRPIDLTPLPITIYHPVFAKFLKLMEEPLVPTHEELEQAHEFVCLASAYYGDEAERISHLSRNMKAAVHSDVVGAKPLCYLSNGFTPDGVVSSAVTPDGFSTIAAIFEGKAEIGEGGNDPIAQAECAYVAVYSSAEVFRSQCGAYWC